MTSSLTTLLSHLGDLGIVLYVKSGRLQFKAPTGRMTPDLRLQIKNRRTELIEFLSNADLASRDPKQSTSPLRSEVQVLHRNVDCTSWLWWQHVGGQHACVLCHPPTHILTVATTNYLGVLPVVDWQLPR